MLLTSHATAKEHVEIAQRSWESAVAAGAKQSDLNIQIKDFNAFIQFFPFLLVNFISTLL